MPPQENRVSTPVTVPITGGNNDIHEEPEQAQIPLIAALNDPLSTAVVAGHPDGVSGHNPTIQNKLGPKFGGASQPFSTNEFQDRGEDSGGLLDYESNRRTELSEPQDHHSQMARALRDKYISSADKKKFLPLDQLETIVNETDVQNLLDRIFTTRPPSVQDICPQPEFQDTENKIQDNSRRKIFAILVLISKVRLIRDFITENITDINLPLEERTTVSGTFLVPRDVDPDPNYALKQTPGGWTCNDMAHFCREQLAISAPYFARAEDLGNNVHHYVLSPNDILPFVKPGTDDRGNPAFLNQGFFSTVRRVKIHHAHHNFPVTAGHDGADFAVKTITRVHDVSAKDHEECFKLEVGALERFCQKDETYIIKLLATYEIDGVYHLLFPVADGNLLDLWKKPLQDTESPACLPGAALWLAQECLGIAQALGKIHRFAYTPPLGTSMRPSQMPIHGIHGDIKPQNVLWFKELPGHLQGSGDNSALPAGSDIFNLGHLQLSDFGTVYFHREMSRMRNIIPVEGVTYRAPETDLPDPQGSPALDIWAFGCLYVDMITWFLCGYRAVDEEFPLARTQDEPEGEDGLPKQDKFFISSKSWFRSNEIQVVKPSVTEWIEYLHKNPRCSQFLHDFLDFIEAHMLVVSPKDRVECTGVIQELLRLKGKCDQKSVYHEAGKPRVWTSFIFNYLLFKRMTKKLGHIVYSYWQMALILIMVAYFLIIMFGPPVFDSDQTL
ncbi:kinase-like protein [Xylaria digitata]|nr:kinase-like protein [Xylaria digitata]